MTRPRLTRGQRRLLDHMAYTRHPLLSWNISSAPLHKLVLAGYVERVGIECRITAAGLRRSERAWRSGWRVL